MGYSIIITNRANKDVREIIEYLTEQSVEKRQAFLSDLIRSLDLLSNNPKAFPLVFSKFRKMVMPDSPYNIYYATKDRKKEIVIARIWHQKRNPKTLRLK